MDNASRLSRVFDLAKSVKVCPNCQSPRARYRLECLKIFKTVINGESESSCYVSASAVKDAFKEISPEDCRLMGFDYPNVKPEYMILSVIPVCMNDLNVIKLN